MPRAFAKLTLPIPVTPLSGNAPPSEFRIFTAGTVDTVKGQFLFDLASSECVMAEYQSHGIDIAIDYDHAMLSDRPVDPALSGKAAGWFNLEVRNGELWAVNVRWTEPAAAALSRKEWRYVSPAFETDEQGRVTSLLNVAITNLPATRKLQPLMAANIIALGGPGMDPKLVTEALDALVAGDAEKCAELLKSLIAAAAGAEPAAEEAPAEAPAPEAMAEAPAPEAAPAGEEDKQAVAASISWLYRETNTTHLSASVDEVKVWKASHLKLEAETLKLAKERQALEAGKRKENAITLTKLGAETPHTSGLGSASGKLCKRLAEEPLDEQNARVAALLAAKGGKTPEAPKPPANGKPADVDVNGLTARDLQICKDAGCDPAVYASIKARSTPKDGK